MGAGNCCLKSEVDEREGRGAGGVQQEAAPAHHVAANRRVQRSGEDGVGASNRKLCRKPPAWKSDVSMTEGQLLSKRDEFWDTAPAFNGRAEIWQALRAAAECEDMDTAQAITSAVNITLPVGNLSVVYDELGNKYEIPPYCLSRPANMVLSDANAHQGGQPLAVSAATPQDAPNLRVKLRMSTGLELLWKGPADTTVLKLKHFVRDNSEEQISIERQCFFWSGQMLTDTQTLAGRNIFADAVVQVMVRPEESA
mmetsp:Transcript_37437/g.92102  ORF Transcript_37437/g.92102 Transcript_37437/m.92102 type:complete len:254 (-) Transcript_37437:113-874(-)